MRAISFARMPIRTHALSRKLVLVLLSAALCGLAALALPALAAAETFTVNSTGTLGQKTPGSTTCETTASNCTLRAAIEAANAGVGGDAIEFAASFNGELADTITLTSSLPTIEAANTAIRGEALDAQFNPVPCTTASGKSGPCVGVSGPAGTALTVDAPGVEIEGLALSGSTTGVKATSGALGLHVRALWIGKKLDGTAAAVTNGVDVVSEAAIEENTIHGGTVGIHVGDRVSESGTHTFVTHNVIDATTGSGILIENGSNSVTGNQVSGAGAAGIRIHGTTLNAADGNEIGGATRLPLVADPSENVIDGSQGAAIEINTSESATFNSVFRNSGSGNTGAFISLVKLNGAEAKAPNNNIQPPTISVASSTGASGTALPESMVRVYAKTEAAAGELGTYLGQVQAESTGKWSITYAAPAGTAYVAASQTPEEEELGSSALSSKLMQFSLSVTKGGTGSGTVTSAPAGISCGTTCSALFDPATLVTLTGAAASGSKPVVWAGCDTVTGTNDCQVTMGAVKGVTATFDTIPADNGGGGNDNGGGGDNSGGSNGGGGGGGSTSTPPPATKPPVTTPAPKPVQCKKGFKKKKVKGKTRCVKVPKKKKH
jgi:hypothetical protein